MAQRGEEMMRSCAQCGATNPAADPYCARCGTRVPNPRRAALASAGPRVSAIGGLPLERAREHPANEELTPAGRTLAAPIATEGAGSRLTIPLVVCLILAIGAAAAFALLWHAQSRRATRAQHSLDATRQTLASTQARLVQTTSQLRSTTALAERRRTVLIRAQSVLTKVDPLLSSVDAIQHRSGGLQSDGDSLSSDADSLVSDLATATDYLASTPTEYVDIGYFTSLLDEATSDYDALTADETSFVGDEASYGTASTAFGSHADAFSAAVRELETQLKTVVKK